MTFKLKNSQLNYATNAFRTRHFRKTYGAIACIYRYVELEGNKIYVCNLFLNSLTKKFEYKSEAFDEATMLEDTRKSHLCEVFRLEIERINYNSKRS